MKRGLVIGKFMPIHNGHVGLIEFAHNRCDELIVSMSVTSNDPIPETVRFLWLKEIFKNRSSIKIEKVEDNFDNESLAWPERTLLWADFVQKRFAPIDVVFSSEEYGEPFAKNLGATHVSFDPGRKQFPVSASSIRKNPFPYWQFIPEIVRPFFVKKICFYGPESTGKTVMAKRMAEKYQTEFVPEVAREFISTNEFSKNDITTIAIEHYKRITEKLQTANKLLFCDTDAITTAIYSQHYLKQVPPIVFELERKIKYDIYFLFDIDVEWVADGLRDLGDRRKEMFDIFKGELQKRCIPYVLVEGDWQEREKKITDIIDKLLS